MFPCIHWRSRVLFSTSRLAGTAERWGARGRGCFRWDRFRRTATTAVRAAAETRESSSPSFISITGYAGSNLTGTSSSLLELAREHDLPFYADSDDVAEHAADEKQSAWKRRRGICATDSFAICSAGTADRRG